MTFSEDSDDYGFFCDLETVKTMEYEEVVFYVVTTKTHYEVRRKQANRPVVQGPPPTIAREIAATKSSTENLKTLLKVSKTIPKVSKTIPKMSKTIPKMNKPDPIPSSSPVSRQSGASVYIQKIPYKTENKIQSKPKNRIISFLKRLPRDIYYSLVVCCTTASCVYLFMSHSNLYDE